MKSRKYFSQTLVAVSAFFVLALGIHGATAQIDIGSPTTPPSPTTPMPTIVLPLPSDIPSTPTTQPPQSSPASNLIPYVNSMVPSSVTPKDAGFTSTFVGLDFTQGTRVYLNLNGSFVSLPTTFVSSTVISAEVPALTTAGTYAFKVANPPPGGGVSDILLLTVSVPAPASVTISPPPAPNPEPTESTQEITLPGEPPQPAPQPKPEPTPTPKPTPVPTPKPAPKPLPQKKCLICDYMDMPQCETAAAQTSEKKCLAAGKDCKWDIGKDRCYNRFKEDCEDIISQKQTDYDWTKLVNSTKTTADQIARLWPKDCNPKDYISRGHSSPAQCGPYFGLIKACVEASPPNIPLNFVNTGCSTFKNIEAVLKYAEEIRKQLPQTCKLTITGNQANSGFPDCTSEMKLVITCKGVTVTYGDCHDQGDDNNFCFPANINQTVFCTDDSGKVVKETCCDVGYQIDSHTSNGKPITTAWVRGDRCSTTTKPKSGSGSNTNSGSNSNIKSDSISDVVSSGTCPGTGVKYWCSNAKKDAQTQANTCLTQEKEACDAQQLTFSPGSCTGQTAPGSIFESCVSDVSCPWTCGR